MTTTEFTRVYTDGTLDEDWPNSWDEYRITVEGVLADDIREKLDAPGALGEISEKRTDGRYSEYGSPLPDYWTISDGEDTISTLDLRAKADDWGIYGVAP